MQFDTTNVTSDIEEAIIALEAEKQKAEEAIIPENTEDGDSVNERQHLLEELNAEIKSNQTLLAFFKARKTFTRQELLALRDATLQQGNEKRQPGGPYEGYSNNDMMLRTEEGQTILACQTLFQQMEISRFL